jgi:ribose transport system ATP-binding protein
LITDARNNASATAAVDTARIALRLRGIAKTYPGMRALDGVDLDVRAGSVHALLGHNGCGKSTLVKALAGVHSPDPGAKAWIDGEVLEIGNPKDAERKGLRFVHQELGIVPELGAADNIGLVLGFEHGRLGRIKWREQARVTQELLARFGFELDPWRPLAEASPPERTAVAVVRAVAGWHPGQGVLVLDEPTASLPAHEVDELFGLIRRVSSSGTAVILVSHRLDEVMAIADHVTVMRAGKVAWDGPLSDVTLARLVELIADAPAEHEPATPSRRRQTEQSADTSPVALEVRDLRSRYLRGIDLKVRRGEVVGVAGLLGSGREELPYIVAGDQTDGVSGTVEVAGATVEELSVAGARRMGVVLVPADRAREGIFSELTTAENVSVAGLKEVARGGMLAPAAERNFARRWLKAVSADPGYSERPISTLSGGNQQKAVLARWLSVEPKVMALSEPTAGVDVGARAVIYEQLRSHASEGLAILMASSDVEDLLASCDRVIVLRDGVIVAELAGEQMTKPAIVGGMEGVHSAQRA